MSIETVRDRIARVEQLQTELRTAREMIKSELENDPGYQAALETAKEATNERNKLKEGIIGQGSNVELTTDIHEKTEELKTEKEILSAELYDHYQKTKSDEIEGTDGLPRKFKVSIKLLPPGTRHEKRDTLGQYSK